MTKKAIIIGAGPAGLWAARTLKQNGIEPILLEKSNHVGGKCSTFSYNNTDDDSDDFALKTERGAGVLTPNYGSVIDALKEKNISLENKVDTDADDWSFYANFQQSSIFTKIAMGVKLLPQAIKFLQDVTEYNYVRDNHLPIPPDLSLSFEEYAEKYNMQLLCELLKPVVTAFGYGSMSECKAEAVMQYMGIGTLIYLMLDQLIPNSSLLSIHKGFQYLMEQVAQDFKINCNATVVEVQRSSHGVKVTYIDAQGDLQIAIADTLVLAVAPSHWESLGLDMTPVENKCAEQLQYHNYPIAVCEIEGQPAKFVFTRHAFDENGYGKLSLITTRDNREYTEDTNGRLCTAYINLPNGEGFSFTEDNINQLKQQILSLPNVSNVKFLEFKVWDDYMPTLPWDTRLALEQEQMNPEKNTLYVGAYPLGGFEDVACVTAQAENAVNKYIVNPEKSNKIIDKLKGIYTEACRVLTFYTLPKENPITNDDDYTLTANNKLYKQ